MPTGDPLAENLRESVRPGAEAFFELRLPISECLQGCGPLPRLDAVRLAVSVEAAPLVLRATTARAGGVASDACHYKTVDAQEAFANRPNNPCSRPRLQHGGEWLTPRCRSDENQHSCRASAEAPAIAVPLCATGSTLAARGRALPNASKR